VFQVAATANGVTYTGTVPTPRSTSGGSPTPTGTTGGNSGGGVGSGFDMTTLFTIGCVALGASFVLI